MGPLFIATPRQTSSSATILSHAKQGNNKELPGLQDGVEKPFTGFDLEDCHLEEVGGDGGGDLFLSQGAAELFLPHSVKEHLFVNGLFLWGNSVSIGKQSLYVSEKYLMLSIME